MTKTAFKALFIIIGGIFLLWSFLILNIYRQSFIDETQPADAIVVLGASQWNGRPSPTLRSRLDHAYALYREGNAPFVILTGGIAEGADISESKVGRNYLIEKGVPKEVIFIEEKGQTSFESLREVADILDQRHLEKILLVSHGFHMMRLKKIAEDLKIKQAFASPVITPDRSNKIKYTLRESVIYTAYVSYLRFVS